MMLITVSQFKFLGLGHSNCQFTFQRQQNLQVLRHLKASLLLAQQTEFVSDCKGQSGAMSCGALDTNYVVFCWREFGATVYSGDV